MIRKLHVELSPHPVAEALRWLGDTNEDEWPEAFRDLRSQIAERLDETAGDEALLELLDELDETGLVELDLGEDEEGLLEGEIHVDIPDLLEDPDEPDAARTLWRLLTLLNETNSHEVNVTLGRSRSTLDEALRELRRQARANGIRLGRKNGGARPPRGSGGPTATESGGTYGGLEDDEPGGTCGTCETPSGNEAAQFFLNYSQVPWPCSLNELKKAFWAGAHQLHPDLNQQDPTADGRFRLFKEGYERCRELLEKDPGYACGT